VTQDFESALTELITRFEEDVARQARGLMLAVEATHPELGRKVNMGWWSIAYRHKRAGYVCGVFLQKDRAVLLFEHGRLLSDPESVLQGDGKQVRFIPFAPGDPGDEALIGHYISEAISLRT
jgi:hypothetical protein